MEARGTYFDGVTSAPRAVQVTLYQGHLILTDIQSYVVLDRWSLSTIRIVRYRAGDIIEIRTVHTRSRLTVEGYDASDLYQILKSGQGSIDRLYTRLRQQPIWKVVFIGLLVMVAFMGIYALFISPAIGSMAARLFPIDTEIAMGEQIKNQFVKDLKIDSLKSTQLQYFYEQAGFKSSYPVHLYYADADVINAFAIPGGHIVIYAEIIKLMQSSDELVALMAHELAHINHRHSVEALTRNLANYLLMSVLTGDIGGVSSLVVENAARLHNLANSRSAERDADLTGCRYIRELGLSQKGMLNLFVNMHERIDNQSIKLKVPQLLSTHPVGENRIAYLERLVGAEQHISQHPRQAQLDSLFEDLKR